MTLTKTEIYIIAAILIVASLIGGYFWLQEHDARLKSEAVQTAQKQVIDTAQKTIDQSKADQAKTNADLANQLAEIAAERKTTPTPQQVVVDVSKMIPNLPVPVSVQNVPATAAIPATATTPAVEAKPATQDLVINQADIPAFQKYKLDCDESNAKLLACTSNAQSSANELAATQAQYQAEKKTADSWEATAKGGTFWQKVGHMGKCLAMSGAGAGLGAVVSSKNPGVGAAIGGAVGTVGCTLF